MIEFSEQRGHIQFNLILWSPPTRHIVKLTNRKAIRRDSWRRENRLPLWVWSAAEETRVAWANRRTVQEKDCRQQGAGEAPRSGWVIFRAAQRPKFKFPFPRSPPIHRIRSTFYRRQPSGLGALGFGKYWHRMDGHLSDFRSHLGRGGYSI